MRPSDGRAVVRSSMGDDRKALRWIEHYSSLYEMHAIFVMLSRTIARNDINMDAG